MSGLWPVVLQRGPIVVRPLAYRDRRQWQAVRARNAQWLRPWDATLPPGTGGMASTIPGSR